MGRHDLGMHARSTAAVTIAAGKRHDSEGGVNGGSDAVRPVRRGGLARRRQEVPSRGYRQDLLGARAELERLLPQWLPPTASPGAMGVRPDMSCLSLSIGVPAGRGRPRFCGHYPILLKSNDLDLVDRARAHFARGFAGMPVHVRAWTPPVRQARMGACLSHADDRQGIGTCGCFLRGGADGRLYALTAWHVLAGPGPVVSPSNARGGLLRSPQPLGMAERWNEEHDACLIGLDPALTAQVRNEFPRLRRPPRLIRRWADAWNDRPAPWDDGWSVLGLRVAMVGAASRYRVGHVTETEQSILFADGWRGRDLFTIRSGDRRPFSRPGDSGSLVFEQSGRRPVGLLIGGQGEESVCTEFNHIRSIFDVDLA